MNDNNFYVVGLSGLAGAGKDLFYKLLRNEMIIERYALADELKKDLRPKIWMETGVDIKDCSREEKDRVRSKLVEYAKEKRKKTDGRHWIRKINLQILPIKESVCITDVRYDDYKRDEAYWLRYELNGTLVHISKYEILNNNKKLFFEAPNEEERRNDPKLKTKADYIVEWPVISGPPEDVEEKLRPYASRFANWLRSNPELANAGRGISTTSQGRELRVQS